MLSLLYGSTLRTINDCVDHYKLWKILKEMGIPDHLTCILRNLYAGQEAAVRTRHGTTDRFKIRKGVHQGCILKKEKERLYIVTLLYLTSIQGTLCEILG